MSLHRAIDDTRSRDATIAALRRTTVPLADLLRAVGGDDPPIPHMTWTVAQCAAHIVISNHLYRHQFDGPGAQVRIEETAALNDWSVRLAGGLRPAALADDVVSSTEQLISFAGTLPPEATFRWWSGAEARVDTALGLLVGERLVHGWDIARAARLPWTIDRADAALTMSASFDVMPLLVDEVAARGFDALIEIRLRGVGRHELRFTDGSLVVRPTAGVERADCRISADPVAMMLVAYGRTSQWAAAARGRMMAWGRRPWAGLRLARVLRNP